MGTTKATLDAHVVRKAVAKSASAWLVDYDGGGGYPLAQKRILVRILIFYYVA